MGHLRLTIGYLKATVVHIRVTLGHLKVTIGFFSISKHKANTTELHPKVRQTCLCRINNIANASHFRRFESFFYTLPDQYC